MRVPGGAKEGSEIGEKSILPEFGVFECQPAEECERVFESDPAEKPDCATPESERIKRDLYGKEA